MHKSLKIILLHKNVEKGLLTVVRSWFQGNSNELFQDLTSKTYIDINLWHIQLYIEFVNQNLKQAYDK